MPTGKRGGRGSSARRAQQSAVLPCVTDYAFESGATGGSRDARRGPRLAPVAGAVTRIPLVERPRREETVVRWVAVRLRARPVGTHAPGEA
jgi:hypothetical protein